jgi:methyl-accepting chemotaxis protein
MTFKELIVSKGWKNFMAKMYGFGASIVIIGAMFKIMHWPFSGFFLVLGLSTEAIIFAFSAFEPPKEELDWTLVYPELAGSDEEMDLLENEKDDQLSLSQKFDLMLEEAKIGPELLQSLHGGLTNLTETTSKLNDISDASVATNDFVSSMNSASSHVDELSGSFVSASGLLKGSSKNLNETYANLSKAMQTSSSELSDTYNQVKDNLKAASGQLAQSYSKVSQSVLLLTVGSKEKEAYFNELHKITNSMSTLSSAYELQLKKANEYLEKTSDIYSGIGELMGNLNGSIEDTRKYKDEISQLATNLEALNNVYGNMLTAMNVRKT